MGNPPKGYELLKWMILSESNYDISQLNGTAVYLRLINAMLLNLVLALERGTP